MQNELKRYTDRYFPGWHCASSLGTEGAEREIHQWMKENIGDMGKDWVWYSRRPVMSYIFRNEADMVLAILRWQA